MARTTITSGSGWRESCCLSCRLHYRGRAAVPRGDERNYHAHILLTLREIDGDGFSAEKARHWNSKELNLQWRDKWAELGARYLAKAGFEQEAERYSYSHLTLKEQFREAARRGDLAHADNLDREPTKHLGPQAAAMERRGVATER